MKEGCPRSPIPLSGELEEVMLMRKSLRDVIVISEAIPGEK